MAGTYEPPDTLTVGVLGPLTVHHAGRPAALGGPNPRAVLARLVIADGRMVPLDVLIEDVWPEAPPPSAQITLQGYISSLRRVLEPDRRARRPASILVRQGPGYALRLPPGALDASRFAELATAGHQLLAGAIRPVAGGAPAAGVHGTGDTTGDPARAAEVLDRALAMWRGPAFADCADRPFALPEANRLRELQIGATEDRLAAALALGSPDTAAAQLQAFTAEHPLRERGWELLALALYRAGRQGDALAALRTARERIADELGIDPGPALAALQHAILRQDPALLAPTNRAAVPVTPAQAAHNLPYPLSTLIGRGGQVAAVGELLDRHRLVTLTGAGGMGKTRLALAVALDRTGGDGPWLVELAGLHDGSLLAETVATALGIAGAGALPDVLRSRRLLLVLDNCEHLVDDVARFVTRLLGACPDVRVLATSREALRAEGEQVYDVPPLASADAVELFVDRAAPLRGGWRPDAAERDLVARLCADLDGMPLAIEFASAQCRVLSLRQIAEHLDDRFTLLRGGRGDSRHATLLAAVDWSYDLLDADEREVFTALAVFEGSFDLAGARTVTGRPDILAVLTELVTKSLLVVERREPYRYRMLETLRRYAARRTGAADRARLVRNQITWVRELAAAADGGLRGPDGTYWMRRMHAESPNVRAALTAATDVGDLASVLRIGAGAYWFWYRRGHIAEGLRFLEPVLHLDDDHAVDHAVRAQAAVGLALLRYLDGALDGVAKALWLAARHAELTTDGPVRALVLATMSYFESFAGAVEPAREHGRQALDLARRTGARVTVAEALMSLGSAELRAGRPDLAVPLLADGLAEADEISHTWAAVSCLWLLAKAELSRGEATVARAWLVRMIELTYASEDATSWLVGVATYAYVRCRTGDPAGAAELCGSVRWLGDRIGYSPEAMDPDLAGYAAEIAGHLPPVRHAAALERGRGRSQEEVMARMRRSW
ncbi:AfsR/SARP family transcriptional regulator [Polymorphospora rubra]|uniref:OmpR/PhoB-type domain-containing protein n=1 Tax=Polymorphospora rubra TaxID=338584 RepID=A0A810MXZ5_9ACTN|nr:BTAD domain-containing putative transcriptional regulator [Polymorphospora rubra]BCJ64228.1 hypothetical protein Prubr_12490 [Polymorphospora rubra]